MAAEESHLRKADHNLRFLNLFRTNDAFCDWAVVVAFYRALHIVEGLFATNDLHSDSHTSRNDALKRRFPDVWREYHPLYNQARYARYNTESNNPREAKSQALDVRLPAIEKAVATARARAHASSVPPKSVDEASNEAQRESSA